MPNFFKKLTGSLKMPEDEEIFEEDEKKEKNVPEEKESDVLNIEEDTGGQNATEENYGQTYENNDKDESEKSFIPDNNYEKEDVDKNSNEEADEEALPKYEDSGSGPYTIAQLAGATTAKKKPGTKKGVRMVGKSALEKRPIRRMSFNKPVRTFFVAADIPSLSFTASIKVGRSYRIPLDFKSSITSPSSLF